MPPLRNKVQPGERRILADEYNAFLAMAKRPGDELASDGFSDVYQASRAYVKNTTAVKVEAFGVLGIDSPVITRATNNPEFFGAPTFNGVTPDIDLHKGKFAILQEPAMPGDTVRAVIAGGTWAWLNVVAEADTTAEVADGVRAYVETGTSGTAKIIWKEGGTGIKAGFIALNVGAPPTGIPFRNDSGETVPAYGVMRVTGSAVIDGTFYILIGKPNNTFQRLYLVNGGSEVLNGATATGTWLNDTENVLYDQNDGTPAGENEWGAWPGQWSLRKGRLGFTMAYGDGAGLGVGIQREIVSVFGKLYDDLEQGGETDFRVWMKYDGQHRDTQMTLTVHDWYMNREEEMKKDTKAEVAWYSGEWRIRNAYCSEDDTDDAAGGALAAMGGDGAGFPQVFVSVSTSGGYISPSAFQGYDL